MRDTIGSSHLYAEIGLGYGLVIRFSKRSVVVKYTVIFADVLKKLFMAEGLN